jgi:multicomponent Na+:H+ antiporter subunit E
MKRVTALATWCLLVWVLLTWTATFEQIGFGVAIALLVAFALAPLGDVTPPWLLLKPQVAWRALRLAFHVAIQIVRANVALAWRVWHRHPALRTGLVVVPTQMRGDAGLTALGLLSSLIVDNQLVDIDRAKHELLYHAVSVPSGGRAGAYRAITQQLEDHLLGLTR